MPTVIEDLVISLKYDVDGRGLDGARQEARKAAENISREFEKTSDDADESAKSISASYTRSAKRTSEIWTGALRQIGARFTDLGIVAVGALASFGKETIQRTNDLAVLSAQTGGTAEELQALQAGFARISERAGTQASEAIITFQENLGELSRLGTGPAKDTLGSLGISLEEFAGLNVEDRLKLFADGIQTLGNRSEQLSAVIEVMGTDGRELLPAFQQGAEGVAKLTQAAREAGQVLDGETIEQTKDLNLAIQETKAAAQGAGLAIFQQLVPQLKSGADSTQEWVKENQELIQQDIPELASNIGVAFGGMVSVLADVVRGINQISNAFSNLEDTVGFSEDTETSIRQSFFGNQGAFARGVEDLLGVDIGARQDARAVTRARRGTNTTGARGAPGTRGSQRADAQGAAIAAAGALGQRRAADQLRFEQERRRLEQGQAFRLQELGSQDKSGGGRRGARRRGDPDLVAAITALEESSLGSEIRKLAESSQATPKALASSLESAARSLSRGASQSVARKAGLSTLSGLTGQDFSNQSQSDPLLSQLLGSDSLPDAPLSDLTQNRQPQVLSAVINNNFTISQQFDIDGANRPDLIPDQIREAFTDLFSNEIQRTSKFAKVNFSR